mmetsp:Transcript_30760/g.41633  ORF Transcript_30760/g.41633 Transcript_30760/m.41633 type:complete len:211 (-) Transcript_30760:111-743(-)
MCADPPARSLLKEPPSSISMLLGLVGTSAIALAVPTLATRYRASSSMAAAFPALATRSTQASTIVPQSCSCSNRLSIGICARSEFGSNASTLAARFALLETTAYALESWSTSVKPCDRSSPAIAAPSILSPCHAAVFAAATPPKPSGRTCSASRRPTAADHKSSSTLALSVARFFDNDTILKDRCEIQRCEPHKLIACKRTHINIDQPNL